MQAEIDSTIFSFPGRRSGVMFRVKLSLEKNVPTQFKKRMPHYTTQQYLLAVFQYRELVMHAINQQGIMWNGGE
ncbi:hypothetical protein OUZ56_005752 [Daphnia magna]|uniref:Uncharacterized protein n=1 Tax=Daphnia magna TaxID=35525 RepID=A0ABQ9YTP9_9CRUS|nr:hypothetical protein OUZ56_005752 [Daphnia magna]